MQETPPIKAAPRSRLRVTVEISGAPATILHFRHPFTIGSDPDCDLAIESPFVNASHAEVDVEDNCWWIRSVEGSDGVFVDSHPVEAVPLATGVSVRLGQNGPALSFFVEEVRADEELRRSGLRLPDTLRSVVRATTRVISIEEHKEFIRRFIEREDRREEKKYRKYLAALVVVGCVGFAFAYYKHIQVQKLETRAREVFYQMKDLELGFSKMERRLQATGDSSALVEAEENWGRLKQMDSSYEKYVDELGLYSSSDERKRAIYRMARVFGECEVDMPEEFVDEVERYIQEWKRSDRLERAVQHAQDLGYDRLIVDNMLERHLPPQFFFLAMQESGFDSSLCGPQTRYGIAKGMWQFIPSTAVYYGLRTGPLVQLARTDPHDERHQSDKATRAAAEYLRDIYDTEAQASGLLVLASYNWGPNAVRGLVREMPENPRERNFWSFLHTYRKRIPKQTYDYVYYIFSAAVIGENPGLFGFSFRKLTPAGLQ
jgi:pSer/pThr/pTyr-binding forkhead associated (FHA) protein